LIKFTGCQDVNGNDINDISPFNNIGDIVSAMFQSGQVYANDITNCDPTIVMEELQSINPINLVVQDIGKEGHEDYLTKPSYVEVFFLKIRIDRYVLKIYEKIIQAPLVLAL
jgi:hypothetical protein